MVIMVLRVSKLMVYPRPPPEPPDSEVAATASAEMMVAEHASFSYLRDVVQPPLPKLPDLESWVAASGPPPLENEIEGQELHGVWVCMKVAPLPSPKLPDPIAVAALAERAGVMMMEVHARRGVAQHSLANSGTQQKKGEDAIGFQQPGQVLDLMGRAQIRREKDWGSLKENYARWVMGQKQLVGQTGGGLVAFAESFFLV